MQRDARALIFDLDDTLYPIRRFVLSGFAAVANHLEQTCGLSRRRVFNALVGALRLERGYELQLCQQQFGLPPAIIPALIDVVRAHSPNLRLPVVTSRMLERIRPTWRTAIITNGMSQVQVRKIRAMGLDQRVETIVYATDMGPGKPDPEPFLEAARRLHVPPARCVFVGDDARCDIGGASRVGMRTIYLQRHAYDHAIDADATVVSLAEVPEIAETLVRARQIA